MYNLTDVLYTKLDLTDQYRVVTNPSHLPLGISSVSNLHPIHLLGVYSV